MSDIKPAPSSPPKGAAPQPSVPDKTPTPTIPTSSASVAPDPKPRKLRLVQKIHVQSNGPSAVNMSSSDIPRFPGWSTQSSESSEWKQPTQMPQKQNQQRQQLQTLQEEQKEQAYQQQQQQPLYASAGAQIPLPQSSLPPGLPYASVLSREFPSLSNNSPLSSGNPSSMWAGGSRPMGENIQRNQPTPLSQQSQQDDFFSASRMNTNQAAFRFGNQAAMSQPQPQPNSIDDFPPLNNGLRSAEGEIGQERGSTLMSTLGFGAPGNTASTHGALQGTRAGNGLLNALSANSRTTDVRSPDANNQLDLARSQDMRNSHDEARLKPPGFRDDALPSQSSIKDATHQNPIEGRNPLGAIGTSEAQPSKTKENEDEQSPAVRDPLAGMAEIDKWGIKGLRTLMNNYPDYGACVAGMDPTSFGMDLASPAPISTQIWSPFSDTPPRPPVPNFQLPDCYKVNNVQPLRNKISSFNEETLMWIFYSCPGDYQQQLAAEQLFQRQWRWHKKLKLWLTKDEIMHPRTLSAQHEEGYYIVWSTDEWRKERRQLTLHYADLETTPNSGLSSV